MQQHNDGIGIWLDRVSYLLPVTLLHHCDHHRRVDRCLCTRPRVIGGTLASLIFKIKVDAASLPPGLHSLQTENTNIFGSARTALVPESEDRLLLGGSQPCSRCNCQAALPGSFVAPEVLQNTHTHGSPPLSLTKSFGETSLLVGQWISHMDLDSGGHCCGLTLELT